MFTNQSNLRAKEMEICGLRTVLNYDFDPTCMASVPAIFHINSGLENAVLDTPFGGASPPPFYHQFTISICSTTVSDLVHWRLSSIDCGPSFGSW